MTAIGDYAFDVCESLESIIIPKSLTFIAEGAFTCYGPTSVYYEGTADDWIAITISDYNDPLVNATRYYYSEEELPNAGNHWYYGENGEILIWGKKQ